mmetsp:Transcript_20848/g.30908  ORF Transcript_20848/g.30908 Transcript_20848/m.30908 type:complete len:458 (+) Transcript_20848:15-1388(+)
MGDRLEDRKDYSEEVKAKLPESTRLAEAGQLSEALEMLLGLERLCRTGNDHANLKEVVLHSLRLCRKCNDIGQLGSTATMLSKRRGQQGRTVTAIVQECMKWLNDGDLVENIDARRGLIENLRDITDGKIFVESERAQLTRMLAEMKEKSGDIKSAAEVMQEVAVETYGALNKAEKTDFILEQVRLTLLKKDFVRALIQSRKINRKVLQESDMQGLKVRFYQLMIDYDSHEKDSFSLAKDYHSIYDTPSIKEKEEAYLSALKSCVVYVVLSNFSNEQQDMLHRIALYPELEKIPIFKSLVDLFTTNQIIQYPLPFMTELKDHLTECIGLTGVEAWESTPSLVGHWMKDLHTRVVQHNIRVTAKYYKRIRCARLAEHLGLDLTATESALSSMVSEGSLYARIDRPAGIISFSEPKPASEVLSNWNSDIGSLLHLLEHTTHLINKETMLASNSKGKKLT